MEVALNASTLARLQAETSELRHRVEAELDLRAETTSWLDYRLYLFRMYGFFIGAERALASVEALAQVVPDASLRNKKIHLLAHDLVALGVERRDLNELPRMPTPGFLELPEALGWMYVLERTTLDSRALAQHLARVLPLEMESAAAFLGCYGDEVSARWQSFGVALDAYASDAGVEDRIVTAALDCLLRLHRWLRPAASHARPVVPALRAS
ncbi:MAG TPA: biliverdin-producing heme oxygenase [Kofleriaceae bacterium]|nr:biliverdin-producing heme oxygenase [Kofleriaceae bacterium]